MEGSVGRSSGQGNQVVKYHCGRQVSGKSPDAGDRVVEVTLKEAANKNHVRIKTGKKRFAQTFGD